MKFDSKKAKPYIYAIFALIGLYALFSLKDEVGAAQRTSNRQNNSQNQREVNRQTRNQPAGNTSQNSENSRSETRSNEQNTGRQTQEQTPQADTARQEAGPSGGDASFQQRYEQAGSREQDRVNQESSYFGFFQITFVMLILGGIGYFVYKYVSKKREGQIAKTDYINVLATSPLANNKFLQVVQIFDNIYILGVGENSVNLITEVKDKNLITEIRSDAMSRLPSLSFKEQLVKFIHKLKPGSSIKNDPEEEALSFFKKQREKLNGNNGNDE